MKSRNDRELCVVDQIAVAVANDSPAAADAYLPLKMLAAYAGLSVRTLRGYLSDPIGPRR